jgi:ATP/maltotriose-dependent transcriptional regulator MalT
MTADGLVRLGELRRRQGRLTEAAMLFDQSGAHPLAHLGRAELAFDRGDARAAADEAERYLRRVLPHNRTDRAAGLDLLVRALAVAGNLDAAKTSLAELTAIATLVATVPMRATATLATGRVALAEGRADAARQHLEDAVDLFLESGAPYEVGLARMELARALSALGRADAARQEARRAIDLFLELKAELDLARARTLDAELTAEANKDASPAANGSSSASAGSARREDAAGLTRREMEVLRLVADGLNNHVIAEKLFVSEHTVHRHVANILTKLSVSSRAAAVAQAARRGLLS